MRLVGILAVLGLCVGGWAFGGETARYINGVEGVKCGSAPPPGYYFRSYEVWYHSRDLQDKNGHDLDVDFKMDLAASVERFIWVTDAPKKTLGFEYGVYALVPLIYDSMEMTMGPVHLDDKRFAVGDLDISPLLLSWHLPRVDVAFAYDLMIPTGDLHNGKIATGPIAAEYWTHMFTVGVTGYLDKEKTWTISLLPRYEIHMEKQNRHFRAGDQFHFEWGVAKALPKLGLEFGLTGYCSWQTTDDKGRGVAWDRKVHDRVFAIGPEVDYFIKPIELNMAVRYQREFGARDRTEGHMTTLTFTKRF
jgi:hypothetical protein